MKIAFLHHSLWLGSGTDSLVYQYSKRLKARGHETKVFCFRENYTESREDLQGINVEVIKFPWSLTKIGAGVAAPLFGPLYWKKLREELDTFDVVITMLYPACLIPMFPKKRKFKWVHIEWSTPPFTSPKEFMYSGVARLSLYVACRKADKVLTASNFVKKWVRDTYGVESTKVYLDGVDFNLFDKSRHERTSNSHNILFVGRLSPHKDILTLLDVFNLVKNEVKDATLTIVGDPVNKGYYTKCLEKAWCEYKFELGDVEFAGRVSWKDLPRYYARCQIFATCTQWEGWQRTEAYAMGKPMITFAYTSNYESTRIGGISILPRLNRLEIPGTTGKEGMARSIVSLLTNQDHCDELGMDGYGWCKRELDIEVTATNLEKELFKVVEGGRSG